MTADSPLTRFMKKVDKRGPNECWPWLASKRAHGYGAFLLNGRVMNSSRAAYLLLVGDLPEWQVVCHSCDNPSCVNPAHLWAGSQADNLSDMRTKGRGYSHGRTVTACPRGHEYTAANTRVYKGRRHCRQCDRDRNQDNERRAEAARARNARWRSVNANRRHGQ